MSVFSASVWGRLMTEANDKAERVRLVIHDDDDTPRSFVIGLARDVFEQPKGDAVAVTRLIERQGKVRFGPYDLAIGETILKTAQARIEAAGLPLQITTERVGPVSEFCDWCEETVGDVEVTFSGKTRMFCEECIDEIAGNAPGYKPHQQEFRFAFEAIQWQTETD